MCQSKMWLRATIEELSSINCCFASMKTCLFHFLSLQVANTAVCDGRPHKMHVISGQQLSFTSETSKLVPPPD